MSLHTPAACTFSSSILTVCTDSLGQDAWEIMHWCACESFVCYYTVIGCPCVCASVRAPGLLH
jgi:hypothetical protein